MYVAGGQLQVRGTGGGGGQEAGHGVTQVHVTLVYSRGISGGTSFASPALKPHESMS